MNGIVTSYNVKRKFGFIRPLVGTPDETMRVFFHQSAVMSSAGIPIGAEVSFRLVRGDHGPQAANVRPVYLETTEKRVEAGGPLQPRWKCVAAPGAQCVGDGCPVHAPANVAGDGGGRLRLVA